MKKIIISLLLLCHSLDALALIEIESLLPNPVGEDTLGEYITIRNRGCESVDLTGYILRDLSAKSYVIPSTTVTSHESISFRYAETKITLNNSGVEEIYLIDPRGQLIDTVTYSGSQIEGRILEIPGSDEECYPISISTPSIPTSTGSITDTGSTTSLVSSGSSYSGATLGESGSITSLDPPVDTIPPPDTSWALPIETRDSTGSLSLSGYITPISLTYSDDDQNGRIDTLEIEYSDTLTGEVFLDSIYLSSATGGLASGPLRNMTGAFIDGVLSGNLLILTLDEFDLDRDTLMIDDTDMSDLRLFSTGMLGYSSLSGYLPEHFSLSTSFSNYTNIYQMVYTGATDTGSGLSDSSGAMLDVPILFPDIFPTLQSPSTVTLSGDTLICTQVDCRINVTFAPMFSNGFALRDFVCKIGTGELLMIDDDCNPPTYTYSTTGALIIEIEDKDTGEVLRKEYNVVSYISKPVLSQVSQEYTAYDRRAPSISLEFDGKIDDDIELSGDARIICHTGTCSLNWTAERSYDPEGSPLDFHWDFGNGEISHSKDPGARRYPPGEYLMVLRVSDRSGNMSERIRYITVKNPSTGETIALTQSQSILSTTSSKVGSSNKKLKKKKLLKIRFFDPPEIVLEGKSATKDANGEILCRYLSSPYCNINLNLSGSNPRDTYVWSLDGEEVYTGKNPKEWQLNPGEHTLTLMSYIEGATVPSAIQEYTVRVIPTPKVSKTTKKSSKTPSKVLPKAPKKEIKKPVSKSSLVKSPTNRSSGSFIQNSNDTKGMYPPNSSSEKIPLTLPVVFLSGALLSYILRKYPQKSHMRNNPTIENQF